MTGDRELVLVNVISNRVKSTFNVFEKESNVRTSCRFTPSAHGFVYTFLVCCKRKYNFCLCYRVDAKKIKVVNAQINLPKLHTKYQSIHTLSKNSHVDDR